jgi:hypothetical protein
MVSKDLVLSFLFHVIKGDNRTRRGAILKVSFRENVEPPGLRLPLVMCSMAHNAVAACAVSGSGVDGFRDGSERSVTKVRGDH